MFYIFDEVPQPPKLDLKGAQLRDPQNLRRIADLLESRKEVLGSIAQLISNDQTGGKTDPAYISSMLPVSIDLVE